MIWMALVDAGKYLPQSLLANGVLVHPGLLGNSLSVAHHLQVDAMLIWLT